MNNMRRISKNKRSNKIIFICAFDSIRFDLRKLVYVFAVVYQQRKVSKAWKMEANEEILITCS